MKRIAVCPGSYDPITVGHARLIRRAAELFGACEVVVMNNREKTYRFSMEERLAFCKAAFQEDENISVFSYEGMLYEYLAGRKDSAVLVKGVRNEKDFLYERKMAAFNLEHCGVQTLYLDAEEEMESISSTLVREKMDQKEDLSGLLPKEVIKLFPNKL